LIDKKALIVPYSNSPIFLAILEIRFNNSNLKDIEDLSKCKNEVVKLFPNSNKHIINELKLDNLGEGEPKISLHNRKVDCFLYSSSDKLSEFTISLDRLNYRQSGPYTNFEDFTDTIKKVWLIHHDLLKDITITGVSIRCFNKIEIHEVIDDLTDFFNISIQVTEGIINDIVTSFSIRYISKNIKERKHSIVSLSLEPSTENIYPFILDIDVHDESSIPNDPELIWDKFESLRNTKDNLFNNILTDKTKSLFK